MTRNLLYQLFRIGIVAYVLIAAGQIHGQVRGVYPLGMSATNSGVTPRPGFTYSNLLAVYSRDQFRGPNGEVLATGNQSVVMDLNSIVWVSKKELLGGAKGPTITPEQAAARYRVNALGFAANVNMPARVNVGIKYFKEFLNRSTFQGHSFQLSGAISF